ncbi:hypothetical protein EES44_18325 [Streptomyces sp. ADI96-15]|nr:hypothetical protein EES44_18325 [Streptomyces sp. ADI96-15]
MQGYEGGRARGVDGEGGSLKTEGVGDAAGQDAAGVASGDVSGGLLGDVGADGEVVAAVGAGEHGRAGAVQCGRVDARLFERLPGGLQEQPLLRVHRQRLTRRDPEELRVEVARVVQESALLGGRRAGLLTGAGALQGVEIPAPVVGERGDGVAPVAEQLPQLLRGADASGEAAAHADDGDPVVFRRGGDGAGRGGRGGVRVASRDEFVPQTGGEITGRGVVEDEGGGEPEPGHLVQPVAQFDGGDRVEAEVAVGGRGIDGLGP